MANKKDETVDLFFEAGRMIRKKLDKEDGHIPFVQSEVLRFVHEHKNPSMRDIAQHLEIRAPSATALVNQLVRGAYLTRHYDESDRRQVRISVTKKAERAIDDILSKRKRVLEALLHSLSDKDHADIQRVLQKMLKNK
jgi:DNA-binding MarR family transcriptional regulator